MATVLVTGGAGYIGSHTCKALAAAGHRPVVYDNLSNGHHWAAKWGPLIEADILDQAALAHTIEIYRPDSVIHFAGSIEAGESVRDPGKYHGNNSFGSLSLLQVLARTDVRHMVFSSTAAVYGTPERTPIPEDHPLAPINPYGNSKLAVERMLADFETAHGLRHVALRYFNAAGADPDGDIGEAHEPETHVIPLALRAAIDPDRRFTVFGTDYPTTDGTAVRDFVHVTDLADAHVAALDFLSAEDRSECFNIGTGQGHSVSEIVTAVQETTGQRMRLTFGQRRPGDPATLVADSGKAQRILNWKPRFLDIQKIVATAFKWECEGLARQPRPTPARRATDMARSATDAA